MKTLRNSLSDYTADKTLEEFSRYRCDRIGQHRAEKRTRLQSLPSLLHLQLKRFEPDDQQGAMIKV